METGNFTVSIPYTGKISGLHHVNRKHSGFHLIRNYPRIPLYATNFRIIPFPKWKFCSGKMETLMTDFSLFIYKTACNYCLQAAFLYFWNNNIYFPGVAEYKYLHSNFLTPVGHTVVGDYVNTMKTTVLFKV